MNAGLAIVLLAVCGATIFLAPVEAPGALAFCALVSLPTIIILSRGDDRQFLLRLFIAALVVRVALAIVIFNGHMEEFFGGDANTYDLLGRSLIESWGKDEFHRATYERFVQSGAGAWGMIYLVAFVYSFIGRNMLSIQLINASIGAATAPVIYHIAQRLFNNRRVSTWSAFLTAFFPSLILWSSQGLKDGLIVMALALSILVTLRLVQQIKFWDLVILTACLLVQMSLRFYIFYMMAAAVVGAFVIGMKSTKTSFGQRFIGVIAIGLALTWVGVLRTAGEQFDRYANLDAVQRSRSDLAQNADSGFGKDVDVRTTGGALTIIPIGLVYLLFAPFPWQLASLRQSIALPEMIVWWLCFPLLILGFWYAIKHRLREISPILLFTSMLTLAYSLFQGNVGTAYRQRSQLLVFYFIFVAVGAVLLKERQEDRAREALKAKQDLADLQAARILARRRAPESQQTI
jgi:dolichyl-phosphate-mannose-protein mannosyltransferase